MRLTIQYRLHDMVHLKWNLFGVPWYLSTDTNVRPWPRFEHGVLWVPVCRCVRTLYFFNDLRSQSFLVLACHGIV